MPELPEVETMRRGVLGIVGAKINRIERGPCKKKPIRIVPKLDTLRRRAVGRKIVAVDRLGKRVVVRLDSGDALVFEPRMTGLVLVGDSPDDAYLRLRIHVRGGRHRQLLFWDRRGLGVVQLLSPAEQSRQLGPPRLGPDALNVSGEQLRAALNASRRAIKVALLDQRAIAGVGNLYASELLHVAGIHPATPCCRLSASQWQRLHSALREVLQTAIHYEGSTLSDGTYRNAWNDPGGYQNHHRVYDRAGRTCLTCQRGVIQRIVQAQRSTFFCPHCQAKRARR
jgi:formamidopyrimidine-DNA glycosylase